jgi:hypothetical protein
MCVREERDSCCGRYVLDILLFVNAVSYSRYLILRFSALSLTVLCATYEQRHVNQLLPVTSIHQQHDCHFLQVGTDI